MGDGVDDQRADARRRRARRGRPPPTPCTGHRRGSSPRPARSSVEVRVAARHREAVGLADERAPHHLDREVEVGGHAADDRELLRVLAPEVRAARADDREQLGDDGGHAVEVAGPARAAQAVGEAVDVHRRARAGADTSPSTVGSEQQVDALRRPRRRRRRPGRAGRRRGPRSDRTASGSRRGSRPRSRCRRARPASATGGPRGSSPSSGRSRRDAPRHGRRRTRRARRRWW